MTTVNQFPIETVRAQFPALTRIFNGRPVAYFDGPGGSQVCKGSIEAITGYMMRGGANLHGQFPSSIETEEIIADARQAVAVLMGAKPTEVAFGSNMTTLSLAVSRALGRHWGPSDELVVSELDHRANVDPWLAVAKDHGMTVRWLKVNLETLTLDLSDLDQVVNPKTKLVAVGLASNAVGTINDVPTIAARARAMGALTVVDAVHAVPHLVIDRDRLGADIILCSTYKFFGPHVGVAVIRENVFEALQPYKLMPAPERVPDKLESGTQNHEGIAGIKPAIEFVSSLGQGETLRERIVSAFARIEEYENRLAERIRVALAEMPHVRLYQAPAGVKKTPTIAFRVDGLKPAEVCQYIADEHSVFIAEGDFYASSLAINLGVRESGGWVRAGMAPYNTEEEVERFIVGMTQLVTR